MVKSPFLVGILTVRYYSGLLVDLISRQLPLVVGGAIAIAVALLLVQVGPLSVSPIRLGCIVLFLVPLRVWQLV